MKYVRRCCTFRPHGLIFEVNFHDFCPNIGWGRVQMCSIWELTDFISVLYFQSVPGCVFFWKFSVLLLIKSVAYKKSYVMSIDYLLEIKKSLNELIVSKNSQSISKYASVLVFCFGKWTSLLYHISQNNSRVQQGRVAPINPLH